MTKQSGNVNGSVMKNAVLTYKLIVEYDGTNYLGFQRQRSTTAVLSGAVADAGRQQKMLPFAKSCDLNFFSDKNREGGPPGEPQGYVRKRKVDATENISTNRFHSRSAGEDAAVLLTIQERLEEALVRLTGIMDVSILRVRASGRTDKGVHATGQVVAFDYPTNPPPKIKGCEGTSAVPSFCGGDGSPFLSLLRQHDEENDANNSLSLGSKKGNIRMELWRVRRAINARLPHDISVRSVHLCCTGGRFEPRENVTLKRYKYTLRFRRKAWFPPRIIPSESKNKSGLEHNYDDEASVALIPICDSGIHTFRRPLNRHNLWSCPWSLDDRLLMRACQILRGKHDFSCFVHRRERHKKNNVIDLFTFSPEFLYDEESISSCGNDDDDTEIDSDQGRKPTEPRIVTVRITLEAKGFRRGMVRNLVGFVVDVSRGLIGAHCALFGGHRDGSTTGVPEILTGSNDSAYVINSAPACGLCLTKVKYES